MAAAQVRGRILLGGFKAEVYHELILTAHLRRAVLRPGNAFGLSDNRPRQLIDGGCRPHFVPIDAAFASLRPHFCGIAPSPKSARDMDRWVGEKESAKRIPRPEAGSEAERRRNGGGPETESPRHFSLLMLT